DVRPAEGGAAGDRIHIRLKYTENRTSVISGLKRVSRPGRRTYVDAKHVPKVLGGMGTTIMSTSQGVMTGHDARKAGVGGEVEVPQPTRVIIKGISKQQVGEIAAIIRKQRPPEPYKGKGIRYQGEYVARKVGKRA